MFEFVAKNRKKFDAMSLLHLFYATIVELSSVLIRLRQRLLRTDVHL